MSLIAYTIRSRDMQQETYYLIGSFRVSYNGDMSSEVYVLCSVPQGSVLGPRLFALYTADLDELTNRHNVYLHSYADDS